jgi:tetratricopeptide (TPR) repeat protein
MDTTAADAIDLIDKILDDQAGFLTQKDFDLLQRHRETCLEKVLPILLSQITKVKNQENWNPNQLYGSAKLAAFFKASTVFDSLLQLSDFADEVDPYRDSLFFMFCWGEILASTALERWPKIKPYIEDIEMPPEVRESCMEALLILVARNQIDRMDLVTYLKQLYQELLSGERTDPELALILSEASAALGPEETLEDLRELFGLGYLETSTMSMRDFLDFTEEGKKASLSDLKEWVDSFHILSLCSSEEELDLLELSDLEEEIDFLDEENLDSDDEYHLPDDLPILSAETENFSESESTKYMSFPTLLEEDPSLLIEIASKMIEDRPEVPSLFYYLHKALTLTNKNVQAKKILQVWLQRFPNDLLGKTELAKYYLRRGEHDLAAAVFSHTWNLKALYPDRQDFEDVELLQFFYCCGYYHVLTNDLEQAKKILQILEDITPWSDECLQLDFLISDYFFEELDSEL